MVELKDRYTIWYDELRGENYKLTGKKNANLGEMLSAGIPISPGFAITIKSNDYFITKTGIRDKIKEYVDKYPKPTDDNIKEISRTIMSMIESADIPEDLEKDILANYDKLCEKAGVTNLPVAVRSSGAVSMPGQMETYLNIRGHNDLIKYVKMCWASSYNVEAIHYRLNRDMGIIFNIGVGIPKMVNSRVSGVIFTLNPLNGDLSKISIDVSYGLGEAVVSGLVTPDAFLVDKVTFETVKKVKGSKEVECVYREDGSDIVTREVDQERRNKFCITNEELKYLCEVAVRIENYYGKPYDIEFGIDADLQFPENIIILQVRPESVWNKKEAEAKVKKPQDAMGLILNQLITGVKVK
jgi:pyruvate,water dikinase